MKTEILSDREKEVLKLIVKEHSSSEIAVLLNLSIRTIDTHRKNILRKIDTRTTVGMIKYAIKQGLVPGFYFNDTHP